jgi:hypothetical protein
LIEKQIRTTDGYVFSHIKEAAAHQLRIAQRGRINRWCDQRIPSNTTKYQMLDIIMEHADELIEALCSREI